MTNERRSAKRLPGPYDGGWNGESGTRECRITDLSVGGCFIDSFATSGVGGKVTVDVRLSGQSFRLKAEVVYVDKVQGFAVRFADNDPAVLQHLSDAIAPLVV